MDGSKRPLIAKYYGKDGKDELGSKAEVEQVLKELKNATYRIEEIKHGERMKKPPLPFTTSTLQQECAKSLNFPTRKTMQVAQQLYEGVSVKGHGTIGLITYLRTDSTRISDEADAACKAYIKEVHGEEYVIAKEQTTKQGKNVQDAHEAIRPTYVELTPAAVKDSLSRDQYRLYQLIWKRFVASRMSAAKYETISAKIESKGHRFTSAGSKLIFPAITSGAP